MGYTKSSIIKASDYNSLTGDTGAPAWPDATSVWTPVSFGTISRVSQSQITKSGATAWDNVLWSAERYHSADITFRFTGASAYGRMIGFASANPADGTNAYQDLAYGLYANGNAGAGRVQLYGSGFADAQDWAYSATDIFRIIVTNGVVRAYQNGTLLRTDSIPDVPYGLIATINTAGASIFDIAFSNHAEKAGHLWGQGYRDRGYGQSYPPLDPIVTADPNTTSASFWTTSSGTNWEVAAIGDGKIAGTELRSIASASHAWVHEARRTPLDITKTYKLHTWIRRKSGNRGVYLVVRFSDASNNTVTTSSGWTSVGTHNYWALASDTGTLLPADSVWREFTFSFGPYGIGTIPTNATHFQVGAILNYQGSGSVDGVVAIQGIYATTQATPGISIPSWSNLQTILANITEWQDTDDTDLPTIAQMTKSAPTVALTSKRNIANYNFASGVTDPWFQQGTTTGDTWTIVSDDDYSGLTKSILEGTNSGGVGQERFANTVIPHSLGSTLSLPGKTFRARGWVRRTAGAGSGGVTIIFRNNTTLLGSSIADTTTSATWELLEVSGTIPADCTRVDYEFRGAANSTFQFDAAEAWLDGYLPSIPDLLELLDTNRLNYQLGNMTLTSSAATSTRSTAWGSSDPVTLENRPTFTTIGGSAGSFTITKTGGTANVWQPGPFDAATWSQLHLQFRAGETNTHKMMGFGADPSSGSPPSGYGYGFMFYPVLGGAIQIYEGTSQVYNSGTYTTSTVFAMTYDGTNVRYYVDDVLVRTSPTTGKLGVASSLYTASSSLTHIEYGQGITLGQQPSAIACEMSVTFASEHAARYFFNTGGEIRIALDHPSTATTQDSNWNAILDDLVVAFRAQTSERISGSTGTAAAIGYYDLTTSYQTILDGTNSGTSSYSTNDYVVQARALSQASVVNGSMGSVLWFRVVFTDQHANNFFDEVSSGTNVVLSHLRATASPLLTAIAAPVCAVEETLDASSG